MTTITMTLTFPKLPTVTAQQKGVRVVHGKPMFYEKNEVKEARRIFAAALMPYAPEQPLDSPVRLVCDWYFFSKSHKANTWRTTRPDTDNLQKLVKDVMTDCGFWLDDSQVCWETVRKKWTRAEPALVIKVEELEDPPAF